ncbi:hypothetical protein A1D26_04305 [Ursidibacter maritimus]|nr:hypothetical protein A1D26_04305 [Ursidibacter maritimus]
MPRDDGQVTIKNGVGGNISYSKAGKLFVYFDGLRKTVELDGAGELHRCTGGTISLHDGEREYSVLDYEYGYYDSTARDKVHITLVRQDDNGIYAAHNEMSDTSRHDVFSSTDF